MPPAAPAPTVPPPTAPARETAAPPLEEELVTFDDRLADLQWNDGRWQLWAGPRLLKDFGRREMEARQALAVLRELHLNQHGTVGSPRAIMEYWLSDSKPPNSITPGFRTLPIDQSSVHVEQVQSYWCVRDKHSTLFNFGGHRDEAERTLAIIKRHGFDRLALIGQGAPVMLVFLAPTPGLSATALHAPPPPRGRMIAPRTAEYAAQPAGDVPPTILQASHMPANESMAQNSRFKSSEMPKGQATSINDFAAAAAVPLGRQLAPPTAPALDLSTLAERVPLDYHQVRLLKDVEGWKLLCGNYVIATFGANEREALLAEMAFRTTHFTEQCLIGHPKPAFSYFLVNGQPPHGLPLGATAVSFRPDELSVRQVNGVWAICDAIRPLFVFGDKADEAKETLKVIQHHHFDAFCRLGQGQQAMTILARTR
jgi:hypothetical protein